MIDDLWREFSTRLSLDPQNCGINDGLKKKLTRETLAVMFLDTPIRNHTQPQSAS
jgi:hypothetical protein